MMARSCRRFARAIALLVTIGAAAAPPCEADAESLPRSVLVFDQSDTSSPWGLAFRSAFRSEISRSSKTPVAIYSEVLELGRFNSLQHQQLLRSFLREKYRDRPIGVIAVHGATALDVFMRLRDELWPSVPVVFAFVDPQTLARFDLPSDMTGTTHRLTLRNVLDAARMLVPNLKRLALVGTRYDKDPFRPHMTQELASLAGEVEFIDLLDLPLTEAAKQVAALPDDAAVYYSSLYAVGAETTPILADVVPLLSQATNRPLVTDNPYHIGVGSTGGNVVVAEPMGEETARRALRILDGEPASRMAISGGNFTRPIFDWRQLRRFDISEASLPAGSEVRFRSPTMWEQYRWQVIGVTAAVAIQSLLIAGLLIERRRRQLAEIDSRNRILQVAHLNRTATAGVMSASIAHELNQPLGAILLNTETVDLLLQQDEVDRKQIEEIIAEIRRDDQRAASIIKGLAGFLKKKGDIELQLIDLNDALKGALKIVEPVATRRGISLNTELAAAALPVRVDPVHLQQVVLNLAINAMDAMHDARGARGIAIQTSRSTASEATVRVSDDGPGIPADKLSSIFETFYTTKTQGSGLGLSIARTIVELYGGKIRAENRPGGGATFTFTLPLAGSTAA